MVLRELGIDEADAYSSDLFEEFYMERVGAPSGYTPLVWEVVGPDGERLGAIDAEYYWGGVVISRLVVAPEFRRAGLGGWLMRLALAAGRRLGATVATVNTFSYQAPDYYPRFGFTPDFVRRGFRRDLAFHYLSARRLAEVGASGEGEPRADDELPEREVTDASGRRVRATLRHLPDGVPPELGTWFKAAFAAFSQASIGDESRSTRFALEAVLPGAAADGGGGRVGTIQCKTFWGVLFIALLTVAPAHRRGGIGTALVEAAMAAGRAAGCRNVCVETFSFQAPGFYTRLGFATDFVLPGWKDGASMYYMRRPLDDAAAAADAAADTPAPT